MATKTVEKWKAKRWFNVYTPKLFGDVSIGEIPADDEKNVVGRLMKVSMAWVTKKPEHAFMTIGLRVSGVNGEIASTNIDFVEQTYSYIHSLVKRHSSVIYTVDTLRDRANREFVLKLVIVTFGKIGSPKKTGIRKAMTDFLNEYAAGKNAEEVLSEILDGRMQNEAINRISNIAEIHKLELKKIELS